MIPTAIIYIFVLDKSNLIEGGDVKREKEKEWYLSDGEKNKKGPYSVDELETFVKEGKV